jgi:Protein of unknown function (DUF2934)
MTNIVLIFMGIIALAVFAILVKTCVGEPKKAEEWEKGQIIKQLLALSERENSISAIASPPARSPQRPASASAPRSDTSRKTKGLEENSKRSYSPLSPNSPVPLRPNAVEIEEQIRQRAFELYQERGGEGGNAKDDWLQAKREVLSRKAKAAKTSS